MKTKTIRINDKVIGGDEPCYIIAEIGANHNQCFNTAKELINLAIDAGADAVKFQSFRVDTWISKDFTKFPTLPKVKEIKKELKLAELSYELYEKILEYCKKQKITCFSTPSHFLM